MRVAEWAVCHHPPAKRPSLLAATLGTLMRDQDWDTFGVSVRYP